VSKLIVDFSNFATNNYYFSTALCNGDVVYRGADKSLARPTSRCILFDDENISFDASLVMNSTNIPPIMIINRIYETQNLLSHSMPRPCRSPAMPCR